MSQTAKIMEGVELERGAWVQDPHTGRLVPKEQYARSVATAVEAARLRSPLSSPQLMRDIEPFRNVAVDGKYVGSRSDRREMMKRHDLVEVGTEKRVTRRNPKRTKHTIMQDIKKSLQQLNSR